MDPEARNQARTDRVVQAAQGVPVLFSGGSQMGDDDLLHKARACVKAGAWGFIFGRNMWKREKASALKVTKQVQAILDEGAPRISR